MGNLLENEGSVMMLAVVDGKVDGNDRAKALYEKCGFVETGRHFRALKYDDGSYRDEFIMSRFL